MATLELTTDFAGAVAQIRERVLARKGSEAKVTPVKSLRASSIGWPCERHLYYSIANWQDAAAPTPEKMALFSLGRVVEVAVIRDLEEAGYQITGQQVSFEQKVKGGSITGHVDGWISGNELGDEPLPLEIKGYTFASDRVTHWRDFLKMKQPWLRAVVGQLQTYLLQANKERGVLVIYDKKSGLLNPIAVELDYELAEEYLKKAERIYDHLAAEVPPDIQYDPDLCNNCDFAHVCQPLQSIEPDEAGVVLDPTYQGLADTYFETEAAAKEHSKAGDALKALAKALDKERLLVGPAILETTTRTQQRKAQEAKEVVVVTTKIRRLNNGDDSDSDEE